MNECGVLLTCCFGKLLVGLGGLDGWVDGWMDGGGFGRSVGMRTALDLGVCGAVTEEWGLGPGSA